MLLNISRTQPDSEVWTGNRISQGKYFSSKIMQKMKQGD